MSEASQVNSAVRQNLGPLGRWLRIEHALEKGYPDWYYLMRRRHGWLECKLAPPNGRAPAHLTLEQLRWAEEELRWGGRWHLLALKPDRTWQLFDLPGALAWYRNEIGAEPLVEVRGAFPTKEIVACLAPS